MLLINSGFIGESLNFDFLRMMFFLNNKYENIAYGVGIEHISW